MTLHPQNRCKPVHDNYIYFTLTAHLIDYRITKKTKTYKIIKETKHLEVKEGRYHQNLPLDLAFV